MINIRTRSNYILLLILLILLSNIFLGCSDNPQEPPNTHTPVFPILNAYPSWSPQGSIIYTNYGISEIYGDGSYVYDSDSSGVWMISPEGTGTHLILKGYRPFSRYSSDGEWILVEEYMQIYRIKIGTSSIDSTQVIQLTSDNNSRYPAWGINDEWVYYDSNSQEPTTLVFDIWKMTNNGDEKVLILENAQHVHYSNLSHNVICTMQLDHVFQIVEYSETTKEINVLSSSLYDVQHPKYSPDGTKILFNSNNRIFVMDNSGENLFEVIEGIMPDWSPSGDKIVFVRIDVVDYLDNGTLWSINIDGTNLTRITNGLAH